MKLTKEALTKMVKEAMKEQFVPVSGLQQAHEYMKKAKKILEKYQQDSDGESWATEEILNHLQEAIDRMENYYGKK